MANVKDEVVNNEATSVARVDTKLEIVVIPVSDVDRREGVLREARVAA